MHLVIPYASTLSEASAQALSSLRLPNLECLLARFDEEAPLNDADEYSLSPPQERVIAGLRGWPVRDGCLPFAAVWAREDGIEVADDGRGWGLLTPVHWQVDAQGVRMAHPAGLQLDEAESHALHEALRPLFEELGWTWHWGAPLRWYAAHASLADTPTASLDRVVGRHLDLWLNQTPALQAVRRLQSEAQMLLHTHPVNEARDARGLQPVNSFWLSGTGPAAPASQALPADVLVDDRLRLPALAADGTAWAEAWAALDAGPVRDLLEAPGTAARLTLCGERGAGQWHRANRRGWKIWRRLRRRAAPQSLLESL